MVGFVDYILGVAGEGFLIAILFWSISYIVIESTSLRGALRAGLVSESIGNIPYLFGATALTAPALAMSVVGGIIFVRMILSIGELTLLKAIYGVSMTYFALIAIVSCAY